MVTPPTESSTETHAKAPVQAAGAEPSSAPGQTQKKKNKKKKPSSKKASKWADRCMYAELLEMKDNPTWAPSPNDDEDADGLPADLQSAWVAVSPVPAGKRCLAVCHQGSGTIGTGTP